MYDRTAPIALALVSLPMASKSGPTIFKIPSRSDFKASSALASTPSKETAQWAGVWPL
jgi:hypothetical protein